MMQVVWLLGMSVGSPLGLIPDMTVDTILVTILPKTHDKNLRSTQSVMMPGLELLRAPTMVTMVVSFPVVGMK